MTHPTIAQALAPFHPATAPAAQSARINPLNDPLRRDEAREMLADLLPERDDWGVEK